MGNQQPQIERKPDRLIPLPASAVMPLAWMRDEVIKMQVAHRWWYGIKSMTTTTSVLTDGRELD